jgi:hypothetical protein
VLVEAVGRRGAIPGEDEVEEGALLRRAPRLTCRGGFSSRRSDRPALLGRGDAGTEAHELRQRGRQYLAEGMVVILGRPPDEPEGGRLECGRRVQHLEDGLQALRRQVG